MNAVGIREEFCMGCGLCEVYCQLQHAQSKDLTKAFLRESPRPRSRIRLDEKGPISLSVRCRHCDEAPCVDVCLSGALRRHPAGALVTVDEAKCVGCWTCLLACPLGAIRQDKERHRILKCDLCGGEELPACVANCPNEALVYHETPDGTLPKGS